MSELKYKHKTINIPVYWREYNMKCRDDNELDKDEGYQRKYDIDPHNFETKPDKREI